MSRKRYCVQELYQNLILPFFISDLSQNLTKIDFPIGNIMSLTRINIYSHNLVNELEDYSTRRSIETLDRGNNSITSTNYTAFIATGT